MTKAKRKALLEATLSGALLFLDFSGGRDKIIVERHLQHSMERLITR
jgi:hypothetical protein